MIGTQAYKGEGMFPGPNNWQTIVGVRGGLHEKPKELLHRRLS